MEEQSMKLALTALNTTVWVWGLLGQVHSLA